MFVFDFSLVFKFLTALFFVLLGHYAFVRPHLLLAPYKKLKHVHVLIKGRILPSFGKMKKDVITKGDFYHEWREVVLRDPESRAYVTVNGRILTIYLIDPELIKVYFQQHDFYEKRLGVGLMKLFLQDGLFSAEGDVWKKHRKIDSQAFHFDFVSSQISLIRKISKEFIGKIDPAEKLSAINFFQSITGEIVCQAFFGSNLARQATGGKSFCILLAELMVDLVAEVQTPMHMLFRMTYVKNCPNRKVKELIRRMEEFKKVCRDIVTDRKERMRKGELLETETSDLLYLLLKYQSNNSEESLSDDEIVHEFITFFLAGMDTTGHLLGMSTYYIAKTPGVKEKLMEEMKEIWSAQENGITTDILNKMEYTQAVFNETFRLATPAPATATRAAKKDHMIGDIPIRRRDAVVPAFLMNFSNPRWFDNPLEFRPDRWRGATGKVTSSHPKNPFIFIPFSAGQRNCIGQHMALVEAKIILSEFMKEFDFEVSADYTLKMDRNFLYEPYEELKLVIRRRSK